MIHIVKIACFFTALVCAIAAQAADFTLSSATIDANARLTDAQVYNGFGCSGENISPQLQWTAGPDGTKSYAVTVYDPDAPTGAGWWHWLVYNIPAAVTALPAGAGDARGALLPEGALQGPADFGTADFGGACPPVGDGDHRYIFTVFAHKVDNLEVPANASAALIGYMINGNKLAQASFTAYYGR